MTTATMFSRQNDAASRARTTYYRENLLLVVFLVVESKALYCGWLLLKCSKIGIGFDGAETNCGIAHILGILLMDSYDF